MFEEKHTWICISTEYSLSTGAPLILKYFHANNLTQFYSIFRFISIMTGKVWDYGNELIIAEQTENNIYLI